MWWVVSSLVPAVTVFIPLLSVKNGANLTLYFDFGSADPGHGKPNRIPYKPHMMVFIPIPSSAFELVIFPLCLLEQGVWAGMARFPAAAATGSSPALYSCGEGHDPSWLHGMGLAVPWCQGGEQRGPSPRGSSVSVPDRVAGAAPELAGVAVKPKPCTSCAVRGRDRAGLAHTGISGAAGPLPGAAASGRLGESWKKAGRRLEGGCRPRWRCDSVGWAPSTQPLPQRWQHPQSMCWSSGKALGDVGCGARVPTVGLARR